MAGTYKSSFCSQKVVRTINPYYLVKTFTFLYSQLVGLQKRCNRDIAVVNVPYEAYGETFVTKYLITVLHLQICFYRPQQSCGQGNIFTPVCHSVHRGVSASVHAGIPPPEQRPPRSRHPPEQTTPQEQTPLEQTPSEQTPPWSRHPPGAVIPLEETPPRADTPRSRHPPGADIPQEQTSPRSRHPPGGAPLEEPPLEQTPLQEQTSPRADTPPTPLGADTYPSPWKQTLAYGQ